MKLQEYTTARCCSCQRLFSRFVRGPRRRGPPTEHTCTTSFCVFTFVGQTHDPCLPALPSHATKQPLPDSAVPRHAVLRLRLPKLAMLCKQSATGNWETQLELHLHSRLAEDKTEQWTAHHQKLSSSRPYFDERVVRVCYLGSGYEPKLISLLVAGGTVCAK